MNVGKFFLASLLCLPSAALMTGCGDDDGGDQMRQQLEMQKAQLDAQTAELREMRVLQSKAKDETITEAEKNRLDDLYEKIAASGEEQPQ